MEETKSDEVNESEEPKKKSLIVKMLMFIGLILVGTIIMIVVSNIVFSVRSASVEKIQESVWAPSISTKQEPLQTYPLDTIQLNLNDPVGSNPVFMKVKLALAFHSTKNVKFTNELTSRTFEIRDLIIRLISAKSFEDINTSDKQLQLKKEIVSQVNSVLINGIINDVYISEFNVMVSN